MAFTVPTGNQVHHKKNQVGQRGFEPQSKRPKRSRIGQATLLSRNKTLAVLPFVLVNQLKAFPFTGTWAS